jgi:sirohydrochlorin ferrochelatase
MKTALLLIAHGSRQPQANADLHEAAELLRGRGAGEIVKASFLELAEPDIVEGGRRCVEAGAQRVVMLPYFLAAGTHVRRDLTQARARLAELFPQVQFLLTEPLGPHPLLLEIVLDRYREALVSQV